MTQVSWRNQLILAATLFGLGILAYWAEFKHKPAEEAQEEQAKKLFTLKGVQVQKIRIGDGVRNFEVDCLDMSAKLCRPGDNSRWDLASPIQSRADDGNSNALLSTLSNLNSSDMIDLKDETPEKRAALLKEYGLDAHSLSEPKARVVEVTTASGTRILHLGGTHPIGEGIFAVAETIPSGSKAPGKIDDSRVFVVPSFFKTNFDHDLSYWRNKKIFNIPAHEIESFQLDDSKAHLSGTKKDGQWLLKDLRSKSSGQMAGDLESIDGVLTAAGQLSAKEFVTENKNDARAKAILHSAKPVLKLTFQQEKGLKKEAPAPLTLSLYEKDGKIPPPAKPAPGVKPKPPKPAIELYAVVSGMDPLFQIEPSARGRMDKDLKELRLTRLITSMERFSARKLEFNGVATGGMIELHNVDGKWKNGSDDVPSEKIQTLLDRLSGSHVKDFVKGSAIPAGENDGFEFALTDDKGQMKRHYVFWKSKGTLYARDLMPGGPPGKEALLIDSQVTDALPWSPAFFSKSPPRPSPLPGTPSKGAH